MPNAIVLPPAKQGDILSDYYIHQPTHIFLIDGEFQQNLSPWHKELVYCLHEGVAVYGSASMGALRAADLWRVGMQGYGAIFEWYKDGTITDDSEVAVAYSPDYRHQTIPLVNLRASHVAPGTLAKAKSIHYASRTPKALGINPGAIVNQKRRDAIGLLKHYQDIPKVQCKISDEHLSHLFHAQDERDRQVIVNGNRIALQHIDAHACFTSPNIHEEIWNSNNRSLALILAEILKIEVTEDEIRQEAKRTLSRSNAEDVLERNALTLKEATSLIEENARVRKLHKALDSTRMRRRGTKPLLGHLRTWGRFQHYARSAPVNDRVELDIEDFQKPVLNIECTLEDYISECGFSTLSELCTAIKIEQNR